MSCWCVCSCYCCRDDYNKEPYYNKRHKRKKLAPKDKHIPNKAEAKLLRSLMSKHKLTEEEIRLHKKFRKELSEEQNKNAPKSRYLKGHKMMLKLLKRVTKDLKLAKEHPKVREKLIFDIEQIISGRRLTFNADKYVLKYDFNWKRWINENL